MLTDSLIKEIEKTAPLRYAAKWDKSGIQIAAPAKDIRHLAVMLDPCLTSVRAALEQGADFILTHHPLALTPRFPDEMGEYREAFDFLLFSSDFYLCLSDNFSSSDYTSGINCER